MNNELAKKLVSIFFGWAEEDIEIIDWSFENDTLRATAKSIQTQQVSVCTMEMGHTVISRKPL